MLKELSADMRKKGPWTQRFATITTFFLLCTEHKVVSSEIAVHI